MNIKARMQELRVQGLRVAHRLAAVDRRMLSLHFRKGAACPVEFMHVSNACRSRRAQKKGSKP